MNQFEMKQSAYRSQLKNRALQVLLYLIDRSDKEQTCFPAVPTIGRELHISVSTVKRAMRELVEAGYVAKESRFREGNRGQTSNLYTLHFPEEKGAVEKAAVSEKLGPMEQAGAELIQMAEEYTEPQSEDQDIDSGKRESVAEFADKVNGADDVSEDKHAVPGVINDCADGRNRAKIGAFAVISWIALQGYGNGEYIRIVRSLLWNVRNMVIYIFQWPGEGVNLIPP